MRGKGNLFITIGINCTHFQIVVSGVYLRLFVANSGLVLRKPKQFMEDLLENMLTLMSGKD